MKELKLTIKAPSLKDILDALQYVSPTVACGYTREYSSTPIRGIRLEYVIRDVPDEPKKEQSEN